MKRRASWMLLPFAVLFVVALMFQGDAQTGGKTADASQDVSINTPGWVVHIDPATKGFTDRPAQALPENLFTDPDSPYSTSHEGLVEEAAPVGDGKMIDLQGRFQQAYGATIDVSGKLTVGCGVHKSKETTTSDSEKE